MRQNSVKMRQNSARMRQFSVSSLCKELFLQKMVYANNCYANNCFADSWLCLGFFTANIMSFSVCSLFFVFLFLFVYVTVEPLNKDTPIKDSLPIRTEKFDLVGLLVGL
jgi:hypothetical protein